MVVEQGKKKVKDILDVLSYEELLKIRRDLENGGYHLLKLVKSRIKAIELSHKRYCSYCGAEIDENSISTYTLVFGPYDFKKKATFCGMDCMISFLDNLSSMKNEQKSA